MEFKPEKKDEILTKRRQRKMAKKDINLKRSVIAKTECVASSHLALRLQKYKELQE